MEGVLAQKVRRPTPHQVRWVADAVARFENEGRDGDATSGRVSAHEILRTSKRSEGAEAEKERLPTAQPADRAS